MAKNIDFKDFLNVNYAPGMPDLIKVKAKRRKEIGEANQPTKAAIAPQDLPPASGKHDPGIGMGWTGKHKIIKDVPHKKHIHVFQYESTDQVDTEELEEALTPQQRRLRARLMKRYKSKIEIGRKKSANRFADIPRLKRRAVKAARKLILLKMTKGIPKEELTFQRRQELEKRLDTPRMKKRIDQLATKLLPKVRQKEIERKRGQQSDD